MEYDPKIHHRRSIRLKGYDYSADGAYFVTICVNKMKCLLGNVTDKGMELNLAGEIAKKWWLELQCKFNGIKIGEYVIMPNHIHGIIIKNEIYVRADLCVCPGSSCVCPDSINGDKHACKGEHADRGEHTGSPLHEMVQWFKTMTTNEYMRRIKKNELPRFDRRFWHRNYYERIIRDEMEWYYTEEYIINNPQNWCDDWENPDDTL
ncbi:MAG: hypothetical protein HZA48_05310 [Planctomycetes bacterium]|nr:hypothetical protein [Planctomycetota bacterium]